MGEMSVETLYQKTECCGCEHARPDASDLDRVLCNRLRTPGGCPYSPRAVAAREWSHAHGERS